MRLKHLDLLVAMLLAGLNVFLALLPEHIPVLGLVLALPLVCVLPGYTLTEALFHRRRLAGSHRLLLTLGLSLSLDIMGGFVLNLLPCGLEAVSWAVLLGSLTGVFALLAVWLRGGGGGDGRRQRQLRFTLCDYLLFGLAVFVAMLALDYAVISVSEQASAGFTQLWMLPGASAGGDCTVEIGVRSFEVRGVTYRVVMMKNGVRFKTWRGVRLAPEEEWGQVVLLRRGGSGTGTVEVRLYRGDEPKMVYREVHVRMEEGCGRGG